VQIEKIAESESCQCARLESFENYYYDKFGCFLSMWLWPLFIVLISFSRFVFIVC